MTLNEIIMQLVLLEEHPAMPKGFQPTFQKVIEAISEMPEIIRCKDCKSWGRLVTYKDGSTMIDCKRGRSMDLEGYCYLAELRGDSDDNH